MSRSSAYGRSKTANILFAVEFDRRHKAKGIRATAVHPGGIATELGRYAYAEPDALQKRVDQINAEHAAPGKPAFSLKSVPQGAATSVWAGVVAPAEMVGGSLLRELPCRGTSRRRCVERRRRGRSSLCP